MRSSKIVWYVVYALAVIILAGVIISAFHNGSNGTSKHKTTLTASSNYGASQQSSGSSNQSQSQGSSSATPSTTSHSQSGHGQAQSGQVQAPGPSSTQLNNTGPGDTAAEIFVAVSLLGTLLHRRFMLKQN